MTSARVKNDKDCSDFYAFISVTGITFRDIKPIKDQTDPIITTIDWSLPLRPTKGQIYDIENVGLRIFKFNVSVRETLYSLYKTLLLFKPITTKAVDEKSAELNMDFLGK